MQSLKLGKQGMKIKFISFLDKNSLVILTLFRMVEKFTFLQIFCCCCIAVSYCIVMLKLSLWLDYVVREWDGSSQGDPGWGVRSWVRLGAGLLHPSQLWEGRWHISEYVQNRNFGKNLFYQFLIEIFQSC